MAEVVLDSSAVLALLQSEPGGEVVAPTLADALISAINYAEVVAKLIENGAAFAAAEFQAGQLPHQVLEATRDRALRSASIHACTRGRGISMGDRFCLALAEEFALPVLTSDRRWAELDIGVEVRLIR